MTIMIDDEMLYDVSKIKPFVSRKKNSAARGEVGGAAGVGAVGVGVQADGRRREMCGG